MGIDVLNLEWSSRGRDREQVDLILLSLKNKGYKIHEASIFDWRYEILRKKPKVILISNTNGAYINFEVSKFAKEHRKTYSLIQPTGQLKWGSWNPGGLPNWNSVCFTH